MRKFNIHAQPNIWKEIECEEFSLDVKYCIFFGPLVNSNTNLCGVPINLATNRVLIIIPRENLISIEEIF